MPTLKSNGITLAYEIHGAGQPLVLIAGVGYGGWFWRYLVPHLAGHCQVITFDNRGAGGSDKPDGPYTVPLLAADTAGLLDGLGLTGAAVLGHSLGGFIAQELALQRPDLVRRLILASTTHGGPNAIPVTPEALQAMLDRTGDPLTVIRRGIDLAAAPGFAEAQPEIVQALIDYRLTGPVPPAAYSAQVMAGAGMAQFDEAAVRQRLAALTMPALILSGECDRVVPPGNAELLASKLPEARALLLPGLGHLFPVEDPQAAARAILDFLNA